MQKFDVWVIPLLSLTHVLFEQVALYVSCFTSLWKIRFFREDQTKRKKRERNKKIKRYLMIGAGGTVGGVLIGKRAVVKSFPLD